MRVYEFNDANDMIELAVFIQSKVYWGSCFYENEMDGNPERFNILWDVILSKISEGYTQMTIEENIVRFYR